MKTLAPVAGIAIAFFSSECFAQTAQTSNSVRVGYEYTGAPLPLTSSNAANVELELPFGNSRFSRLYSLSVGKDGSRNGFYARAPGGLGLSAVIALVAWFRTGTLPAPSFMKTVTVIPDGVSFDLMRGKRLRTGVYTNLLTIDFRNGDWHYAPEAGLRSDFQLGERTFLFARAAAKRFNKDKEWVPQIIVGVGRDF